jgi:Spy/CpxP family protein refolding chaperone
MANSVRTVLVALLLAAWSVAGVVQAAEAETQDASPDSGWGPGMMGGYGGYGYHVGPRGGYGMGPGMMGGYGGYGMGPGMMGGYGYHMGPRGGCDWGPGMMGGHGMWALSALNLTDDQRAKINKILDNERKQHWAVMGKMMDEQIKLRDLYAQSEPDPKKVGAAYGAIAKLQQQMIEAHVQAGNEIHKILTKEQREQMEQWRHGGWGPGGGPGPHGMPPR